MKKIVFSFICLLSIGATLHSQVDKPDTAEQKQVRTELAALTLQRDVLYNKLRDITEFQQYLQTIQNMAQAQNKLTELSKPVDKPKPKDK